MGLSSNGNRIVDSHSIDAGSSPANPTNISVYMEKSRQERRQHLRLDEACFEIGGNSTNFRGILAFFLKTTIPSGTKTYLCHGCNNGGCSNPRHLYWGTPLDNSIDRQEAGTQIDFSKVITPEQRRERGKILGTLHGGSNKLTADQLTRYKKVFDTFENKHSWVTKASKELNVSRTTIRRIYIKYFRDTTASSPSG